MVIYECPDKLSVTAIEYERAKKRNIPHLIFSSNYEKEKQLMKFEKISDFEEGVWRVRYNDSADLINHVIRNIPKLVDGITQRQVEKRLSPSPASEVFPSIASLTKLLK